MTRVSSESQRLVHQRAAFGQRGQQQHAVGDALRARQAHRARGSRAAAEGRGRECRTSRDGARWRLSAPAARRGVPICQLPPAFAGHAQQLLQRRAVAGQHHLLQRVERLAEALRLLQHLFAVGQQDVAPHRRVAGGDAGEVAKARSGQRQQVAPGRLAEHAAEVGKGQQVRQVADRGEGAVVVLGRHLQHLRADGRPDSRWPSAPAPAWSAAAASGSPGGRCTARRRHAGCPSLPCRRSGAPARSWRCARAARAARHRPRRAWCCPRPSPARPVRPGGGWP